MQIILETERLQRADAEALLALIDELFPDIFEKAVKLDTVSRDVLAAAADNGYNTPTMFDGVTMEETLQPEDVADVDAMDPSQAFGGISPAEAFADAPLSPAAAAPAGAPTSPTAGAPASPSGVETDADGLPWDARIHAGTKSKNADGRWKAKKGVHEETKKLVTAELRQVMSAAPAAAPSASAPPAPPAPPSPAPASVTPPPPPPAAAPPAVPTAASTPPAAATTVSPQDVALAGALAEADPSPTMLFQAALLKTQQAIQAGKITPADMQAVITELQLTAAKDLLVRPDLIPEYETRIQARVLAAG